MYGLIDLSVDPLIVNVAEGEQLDAAIAFCQSVNVLLT